MHLGGIYMVDIILDTLIDGIKLLPFLFIVGLQKGYIASKNFDLLENMAINCCFKYVLPQFSWE